MNPTKAQLETVAIARYRLIGAVALILDKRPDGPSLEALLTRCMEHADSVVASGEIPDWEQVREILKGTLRICQETLQ